MTMTIPSSTGSTAATLCSAGTYSASANAFECTPCDGGEFQDGTGETACKACTGGNYCPDGASTPQESLAKAINTALLSPA